MARLGLQLLVMTLVLDANFIHINQESHVNNLNSTRGIRSVKLPAPVTVSLLRLGPETVEINQARAVIMGPDRDLYPISSPTRDFGRPRPRHRTSAHPLLVRNNGIKK